MTKTRLYELLKNVDNFEDYINNSIVVNSYHGYDTNIVVSSTRYIEDMKKLYEKTIKSKSNNAEFRIISSYDIIDENMLQVFITDEYKDMILNDIDY